MSNTALLVIDMQVGLLEDKDFPIHLSKQLISYVIELISKARAADATIIFVRHTEPSESPLQIHQPGWQISSELTVDANDIIVNKYTPDCFHQTSLDDVLKQRRIANLVIAGLQSEYCIDTTCRRASTLGYQTTLISDAHSTCDSNILSAQMIIEHHNQVLSSWFVTLNRHDQIDFI